MLKGKEAKGSACNGLFIAFCNSVVIQCVPFATEPGISWIILTSMKILQRNWNKSMFIV